MPSQTVCMVRQNRADSYVRCCDPQTVSKCVSYILHNHIIKQPANTYISRKGDSKMPKIKEKLTNLLSLPKEIVLDLPVLMATGRNEINVENYKSLIEFTETRIRIRTKDGEMAVEGEGLKLRQITTENILIYGKITGILYR